MLCARPAVARPGGREERTLRRCARPAPEPDRVVTRANSWHDEPEPQHTCPVMANACQFDDSAVVGTPGGSLAPARAGQGHRDEIDANAGELRVGARRVSADTLTPMSASRCFEPQRQVGRSHVGRRQGRRGHQDDGAEAGRERTHAQRLAPSISKSDLMRAARRPCPHRERNSTATPIPTTIAPTST